MAERRLLIVGSGERVRRAALPVFLRTEGIELAGLVSRHAKRIESEGREHAVSALEELDAERVAAIDLVYMVVAKPAVPAVLEDLARFDLSGVDLVIETPVMLVRHLGHLGRLDAFRSVSVSEDTARLPCFDPVHALARSGELGELERVEFEESAYAYHGVAMAKAVLEAQRVRSARQRRRADGRRDRHLDLRRADGTRRTASIIDPRDYSRGKLRFHFAQGLVSDHGAEGEAHALEVLGADKDVRAFRAGEHVRELDAAERELLGERGAGPGLCAWMDGLKRVGFLALARELVAGGAGYSLEAALEDAVVDYHLERLKRYRATALTDPGRPLARLGYKVLTRLVGARARGRARRSQ